MDSIFNEQWNWDDFLNNNNAYEAGYHGPTEFPSIDDWLNKTTQLPVEEPVLQGSQLRMSLPNQASTLLEIDDTQQQPLLNLDFLNGCQRELLDFKKEITTVYKYPPFRIICY